MLFLKKKWNTTLLKQAVSKVTSSWVMRGLPMALGVLVLFPSMSTAGAFHDGVRLMRTGRFDLACEQLQVAVKENPNHAESHYGLGVCYRRQHKEMDALEHLLIAEELTKGKEPKIWMTGLDRTLASLKKQFSSEVKLVYPVRFAGNKSTLIVKQGDEEEEDIQLISKNRDAETIPASTIDPEAKITKGVWGIKRQWNQEELGVFARFIDNIYEKKRHGKPHQRQAFLDEIINDSEMNLFRQKDFDPQQNPDLAPRDIKLMRVITHCGSFPKLLQIYFAYKRGLPLAVGHVSGKGGDIRYSKNNKVVEWIDNYSFKGNFRKFLIESIVSRRRNHFTTGNYRTDPDLENSDSVPLAIDRRFLMAGTIAYNAGGHALLVGRVTSEGDVYFLDAHPDCSITYSKDISVVSNVNTLKSRERCYGGFRMLRPAKLAMDAQGRVQGVRPMNNQEMKEFGYSLEQYEQMKEIKRGKARVSGVKVGSYQEFVRKRLRNSDIRENPLEFIEKSADRLKEMFETRSRFVSSAWDDVQKNGPITFPDNSENFNIYQAEGRWETWSSPSSDVDRKCAVIYVGKRIESMLLTWREDPQSLDLSGFKTPIEDFPTLVDTVREHYEAVFSQQRIAYQNSAGKTDSVSLMEICDRLWDLSFDPNHAPELRWGLSPEQAKRYKKINTPYNSGVVMSPQKAWKAQQKLRYLLERQDSPTILSSNDLPRAPLEMRPRERMEVLRLRTETSMKP